MKYIPTFESFITKQPPDLFQDLIDKVHMMAIPMNLSATDREFIDIIVRKRREGVSSLKIAEEYADKINTVERLLDLYSRREMISTLPRDGELHGREYDAPKTSFEWGMGGERQPSGR